MQVVMRTGYELAYLLVQDYAITVGAGVYLGDICWNSEGNGANSVFSLLLHATGGGGGGGMGFIRVPQMLLVALVAVALLKEMLLDGRHS